MKYVAAYLLAVLGGNETPTSDDVRNVITSVGIDVEEEKLKLVMEKLKGKNLEEIQKEGLTLLAKVFGTCTQCETKEDDNVIPEQEVDKNPEVSDTDGSEDEEGGIFNLFGD